MDKWCVLCSNWKCHDITIGDEIAMGNDRGNVIAHCDHHLSRWCLQSCCVKSCCCCEMLQSHICHSVNSASTVQSARCSCQAVVLCDTPPPAHACPFLRQLYWQLPVSSHIQCKLYTLMLDVNYGMTIPCVLEICKQRCDSRLRSVVQSIHGCTLSSQTDVLQ